METLVKYSIAKVSLFLSGHLLVYYHIQQSYWLSFVLKLIKIELRYRFDYLYISSIQSLVGYDYLENWFDDPCDYEQYFICQKPVNIKKLLRELIESWSLIKNVRELIKLNRFPTVFWHDKVKGTNWFTSLCLWHIWIENQPENIKMTLLLRDVKTFHSLSFWKFGSIPVNDLWIPSSILPLLPLYILI